MFRIIFVQFNEQDLVKKIKNHDQTFRMIVETVIHKEEYISKRKKQNHKFQKASMSSYAFGNPFSNPDDKYRDSATPTTASSSNLTPTKGRSASKLPDMNTILVEKGSVTSLSDVFKKQKFEDKQKNQFSSKSIGKVGFHNKINSANKMQTSNIVSANSSMISQK